MRAWKVWFTHESPYSGFSEGYVIVHGENADEVYEKFYKNHDKYYEIQSLEPLNWEVFLFVKLSEDLSFL